MSVISSKAEVPWDWENNLVARLECSRPRLAGRYMAPQGATLMIISPLGTRLPTPYTIQQTMGRPLAIMQGIYFSAWPGEANNPLRGSESVPPTIRGFGGCWRKDLPWGRPPTTSGAKYGSFSLSRFGSVDVHSTHPPTSILLALNQNRTRLAPRALQLARITVELLFALNDPPTPMVRLTSLPSTATQATLGWVSALISVRYLAGLVLFAAYSRSTALGRIASSHRLLSGYQAIRLSGLSANLPVPLLGKLVGK